MKTTDRINKDYVSFKRASKEAIEKILKNESIEYVINLIKESYKSESIFVAMIKNDDEFNNWLISKNIIIKVWNENIKRGIKWSAKYQS